MIFTWKLVMMYQRVFVDTSIFFKWIMWFVRYKKLSFLEKFFNEFSNYKFYVSTYVIEESILHRDKLKLSKSQMETIILDFLKKFDIFVINSDISWCEKYLSYVNDVDDTQILYDAVKAKADILFTNNIKDFKIHKIEKDFKIKVVDRLEFV